jgi:hypothetical protein
VSTEAIVALVASSVAAFFVALRGLLVWGLNQWKEQQGETRAALRESTKAMTDNAVTARELILKLDAVMVRVDHIGDYIQEHTPVNQPVPRRGATPGAGVPSGLYGIKRSTNDR